MGNLNKVMIIGRLGQKPEKKMTTTGKAVCSFSVATSDYFNDRDGNKQERTEWHRVVLWEKMADLAERYLDKGSQVYIEGRLQTREWNDKDNVKKYTTEIVGQTMQFLDSAGSAGRQPSQGQPAGQSFGQPRNHYQDSQGNRPAAPGMPPSDPGFRDAPSQNDYIEDDVPF